MEQFPKLTDDRDMAKLLAEIVKQRTKGSQFSHHHQRVGEDDTKQSGDARDITEVLFKRMLNNELLKGVMIKLSYLWKGH